MCRKAYLSAVQLGRRHVQVCTRLLVEAWFRRPEVGQVSVLGLLVNKESLGVFVDVVTIYVIYSCTVSAPQTLVDRTSLDAFGKGGVRGTGTQFSHRC